jgi:formylglycine-generating enzyme required for sulfatase activity
MWRSGFFAGLSLTVLLFSGSLAVAGCPSADVSGDCFVDYEDFALLSGEWLNVYDSNDLIMMASQWLSGDANIPGDMVYIPGGEFEMGDQFTEGGTEERPVHAVSVDSFFMGSFEISNQQYCDYLNSALGSGSIYLLGNRVYGTGNGQVYCDTDGADAESQIDFSDPDFSVRYKGGRDMSDDPMQNVSWYGAVAYCNWRSGEEGHELCYNISDPNFPCDFSKHGYRLATEAEWEYASRGGEHNPYYRFPWGDGISHSQANYRANGNYGYDGSYPIGYHPDWDGVLPHTSVVGSFVANGYGLYDMAGNVFEWCNDWYDSVYYDTSPYDNPTGPASGTFSILRGGSWYGNARYCRAACRYFMYPDSRDEFIGFRIVLDLN